ncbi:uncharacterized protein LOC129277879 [Lytechinus pictus]|uniref:uncharacterized protein LOC129277879 n=1 Tax=Lytechinus pictus TaxID=7653 RepID=UPI0030B9C642
MEAGTEEDHHEVQQDIQQIHKVLGENKEIEEEEESDEDDDGRSREEDGAYLGAGPSTSGGAISQVSPSRPPVPESLFLSRSMEPTAENLLQVNLSYQDMVCTLLDNIKEARRKNAAIQKSVASKTTTYVKGARPITHFQKHYFSGDSSTMPPLSDEAKDIKSRNIPMPFIQPAKSWTADEDRALYEGVRNDGLQRVMKPLMARQEILYEKRRLAIDDEKHQLTVEINNITTQLEHLKAPEEELLGDRMRDMDWLKISSLHLNGERSAMECQLRWQNILHPFINKKAWSAEEEKRLDEVLETVQGKDWSDYIRELGTNRSPFDCFSNYQHRDIYAYVLRPFTEEEDELILELAERFKVGDYIPFSKVAYFMDQRLGRQIALRWRRKLDPDSKRGFWTKEEDDALLEGIQKFGFKWSKLSKLVRGRNSAQVRDRWSYTLDPSNRKGNYTLKEDLAVLQNLKEHGVGHWVTIAKKLNEVTGISRTPNSILHRFNTLFQMFFKKAKGISLHEGDSMDVLSKMPLSLILDEMIEYRQSLGEINTLQGSRNWKDLYTRKRRKPRSPPPRILAKNASFITRRNVLSELDREILDAIKPIGWAYPTISQDDWRSFYRNKEERKQRRHYIFSVLLKALDISMKGNEAFLASMLTNHKGVQALKDHQLIPKPDAVKTERVKVPDDDDDDEVELSEKEKMSSKNAKKVKKSKKAKKSEESKYTEKPSHDKEGASATLPGVQETGQRSEETHVADVSTSQPSVAHLPENVPVPQGNASMMPQNTIATQGNVLRPQVNGSITQASISHSQFGTRPPMAVLGNGSLAVKGGYLVPLKNYVSQFGCYGNQTNLVTVMQPRLGGAVHTPVQAPLQTPMQPGGLPGNNMQIISNVAPPPMQGILNIPQQTALFTPQVPLIDSKAAVRNVMPLTTNIAGMQPIAVQPPLQQPPRILHVPGKGYLIPVNCIKKEPGVAPINPTPILPKPVNFTPALRPLGINPGQVTGMPLASVSYPAPRSIHPATQIPISITAAKVIGNGEISKDVDIAVTTGTRYSVQEKECATPENQTGKTLCSEAALAPINEQSEASRTTKISSCETIPDSGLSISGQSSSNEMEEQERGSLPEGHQLPMDVDKETECPNVDTSSGSQRRVKFDAVLPVLPPNESTIAGLMALLLDRKRLEVTAKKNSSIKKVGSWNLQSNKRGILRGSEGLLQELSSKESSQEVSKSDENESVNKHKAVKGKSAGHTKAAVKYSASGSGTGEGKWEIRVPVSLDATKKAGKKDSYWVTTRNTDGYAKALDRIRKSDWYKALHPRFLSMFLWPALLSIVGPHKKKVLLPKKKPLNKQQSENQPSTSQELKPKSRKYKYGQHGRKKYKRSVEKTTPPKCKPTEGKKEYKRGKRKDVVANPDGVARRTRSASQKNSTTEAAGQDQKRRSIYVVPSDSDSEFEDQDEVADVPTSTEVHPQVLMSFGYPEARKGTEVHPVGEQSGIVLSLLQQLHESSGMDTSKIKEQSSSQEVPSVPVSSNRPESPIGNSTKSVSQTAISSNSKKRPLEDPVVSGASPKRAKED